VKDPFPNTLLEYAAVTPYPFWAKTWQLLLLDNGQFISVPARPCIEVASRSAKGIGGKLRHDATHRTGCARLLLGFTPTTHKA